MDTLIPNHQPAPEFSLPDTENNMRSLRDFRGRITLLNFWSAECPWAHKADKALLGYLEEWEDRVAWISIASNANEPPEMVAQTSIERNLPIVLLDANQQTADLYAAKTTPHFFLIDLEGILRYQGAFDDVTFRKRTPTRHYLKEAVVTLLAGRLPEPDITPPYGCTVVRHI